MALEVLRPQDYLIDQFRTHPAGVFPRRRILRDVRKNGRSSRKQVFRSKMKRNGLLESRRSKLEENLQSSCRNSSSSSSSSSSNAGIILGQVTILRRGKSLDSQIRSLEIKKQNKSEADTMLLSRAGRLRSEPMVVPREEMKAFLTGIRDVYVGSAFVVSPSPSDMPLPFFLKKMLQLST